MKLCVIGMGYVGLVTATCFADSGNTVWCVDKDTSKIEGLKKGRLSIYEPGLHMLLERNLGKGRLHFTSSLEPALSEAEICFITVDTPSRQDGKAEIKNVLDVAVAIGSLIDDYKIVVTKSTVPVGTTFKVKSIIEGELLKRGVLGRVKFDVASNPEFLKEGNAVNDFQKPARVIVGVENDTVAERLHLLYAPYMRKGDRFLKMSIPSAELAKYAANAMLAARISFMNSLARLCERVGADVEDVRVAVGRDPRIGSDFLFAGLGYGGSCFPKDVKALVQLAKEHGVDVPLVEATHAVNEAQVEWFFEKLVRYFGNLAGRDIAVWGLAFKAGTDDIRESAALRMVDLLLQAGARVRTFDPAASVKAKAVYGEGVMLYDMPYDCLEGADALVVCTDWNEFRNPDFGRIRQLMKTAVIFDGRNLYDVERLKRWGIEYFGVGRCTS